MDRCILIFMVVVAALAGVLAFAGACDRGVSVYVAGAAGCFVTGAGYLLVAAIAPINGDV